MTNPGAGESKSLPEDESEAKKLVSVGTMERLKSCPGFVEVDPRLLQVFTESITMNNDVGYFRKDMACQTDESSITALNNMIKIIQVSFFHNFTIKYFFAKKHACYITCYFGGVVELSVM